MRDTLYFILVKHFGLNLGKKGPLHDGYMRVFIESFFASQASTICSSQVHPLTSLSSACGLWMRP